MFHRIHQVAPICSHGRAHCRHLAYTFELSVCGSDAALCQITLTTCCIVVAARYAKTYRLGFLSVCWSLFNEIIEVQQQIL